MDSIGVLIPILGICCGIIAVLGGIYIKSQKLKLEIAREERVSGASSAEAQNEVQRLKDRVAVLERLLTDDDRKLAAEIERLGRDRSGDIRG
jgi:hypothetical protein